MVDIRISKQKKIPNKLYFFCMNELGCSFFFNFGVQAKERSMIEEREKCKFHIVIWLMGE